MFVTRVRVDNDTDLVTHGEDRWGQTLAVAGALADLDVDLDVEHGSEVPQHDRETPVGVVVAHFGVGGRIAGIDLGSGCE